MHQADWLFSSLHENEGKQVRKGGEAHVLIEDHQSCGDCMAKLCVLL